ncbi:MAG: sigma-70 family RNA polymerase sigma factor [Bacteroidetes bacterium]|nr:sigma-70 family RNA polymerase sigma factor [Bacteroidota bacterium]
MEQYPHVLDPGQWIDRYAGTLFKFAVTRVSNSELSKDLVQETFLSALKNAGSFRGEVTELNWLYAILKNKIIDYYRSKAKLVVREIQEAEKEINSYFDEEGNWQSPARPADWKLSYSDSAEASEFYEVIERCKRKLAELQNVVFTMKYLDEKSSEEICKELEISSSNFWVLVHRARLQMRQCLEKNWFIK